MTDYMPLALLKTRSYPAYQFLGHIRYDGRSAGECMNYVILTVMSWIRQKLGNLTFPEELLSPDSSEYMNTSLENFCSFHFHEGIHIDITCLPDDGIWTLHIKEPDTETTTRKAVIGRFFMTEVALKLVEDLVHFAVRIDVLDPMEGVAEVDYAFRPAFMRSLFSNKKLRITQVDLLRYDESYSVNNSHGLRHMMDVLRSPDNYMPCIIFTYALKNRKVMELVETLDEALGLVGAEASFKNHLSTCSLVPEMLEYGSPYVPYDAEHVARHAFGYGRVYLVEPNQFRAFQMNIGQEVHMGDILWCEPVKYGGDTCVLSFHDTDSAAEREKITERLLKKVHCYSKHKIYDYVDVVFEESARRKETEHRIHSLISELRKSNQQETQELYQETEKLLELYDSEEKQMREQIEQIKRENRDLSGKLMYLDGRLNQMKKPGILQVPEIKEFYPDEQYDLVVSILEKALQGCLKDTRAYELLEGILACNPITGEGKVLFDTIKNILYRNNNLTEKEEQELRKAGFTVTKRKNGHYKLVFQDNPRYTFTLSGTSGDVHAMKNAHAEIDQKLSIY